MPGHCQGFFSLGFFNGEAKGIILRHVPRYQYAVAVRKRDVYVGSSEKKCSATTSVFLIDREALSVLHR